MSSAASSTAMSLREELLQEFAAHLGPDNIAVLDGILEESRNRLDCVTQLRAFLGLDGGDDDMPPRTDSNSSESAGTGSGGMGDRAASSTYFMDYDAAVATGEEAIAERKKTMTASVTHQQAEDVFRLGCIIRARETLELAQAALGAQSLRPQQPPGPGITPPSTFSAHSKACIALMVEREKEHCGPFAVFYHSYSLASLIYEVNACVAAILYGVKDCPPMPRMRKAPFLKQPHVKMLLQRFSSLAGQDHNPEFRALAISVSCSLTAPASEAPPLNVFESGYSCGDLSFDDVLRGIFHALGASTGDSSAVAAECLRIHDAFKTKIGGGGVSPGHMLQIFVRRHVVDDVAYGSHAYGVYDPASNPLSTHLQANQVPPGQARVFWHPFVFLDPKKSRVYHYAASADVMAQRGAMRERLMEAMAQRLFNTPAKAAAAFRCMENGIEK